MSLDSLSKDIARHIGSYLGNSIFALSSINKRFRGFFQEERQKALKKSKIMVKKNLRTSFLLTWDGKFFATGNNYGGQFGIGEKIEKWKCLGPVEKKVSRESPPPEESVYKENIPEWMRIGPPEKKISRVVLSATENVYVECEDGWYGAGSNLHFQLDPHRQETDIMEWVLISPPSKRKKDKIVELIATDGAIFIRCQNGRWYRRGSNRSGQLSPLFRKNYVKEWIRVGPPRKKVLDIVTCFIRTFVRCEDGWYGCGKNENGELGRGYFSLEDGWKKIELPGKKIKYLKATELNTLIQCDDEEWYGCGYNEDGRLGTGNAENAREWIRLGPVNEKIQKVGLSHDRFFLLGNTEIYSCGWNEASIFGGYAVAETFRWRRLEFPGKPIDELIDHTDALFARCGEEWYGVGWDEDGYFGLGREAHRYEWNRLSCKGKNIDTFLLAYVHAFVCGDDGWYVAGDVSWGQSGRKDKMEKRACWTKVLSHDETVEEMLQHVESKSQSEVNLEIQKIDFRKALKKLYQKNIVKLIEDLGNDISGQASDVYIFYDKTDGSSPGFDFFVPIDYWEYGDEEFQFNDRLQEILEYEYSGGIRVWRNRNFQDDGLDERYSSRVQISEGNYEAVVSFLKKFEHFLDQREPFLEENLIPAEGAEPERKHVKRG